MKKKKYLNWIKIFCLITLLLLQILSMKNVIAATLNPEVASLWITPAYQEITGNSITLNWNVQSGATSYDLYQSTDTSFYNKIASVTGTSYTASTLSENTRYHFEIVVNYSDGSKKLSNARTVYIKDSTSPNAPSNLARTNSSDLARVNISWDASTSTDVHHYEIWRRDGAGANNMIGVTDSATKSYSDVGVSNSSTHYYYVVAVDNANNKSASSTTLTVTGPSSGTNTAIGVPTFNNASLVTKNNIKRVYLSWTAPASSNIAGYEIFRKADTDSQFSLMATTLKTSFVDPTVEHYTNVETQYSYYIKALNTFRTESGQSATLNVTVPKKDMEQPGPPTGLKATSITSNKIDLSWTEPSAVDLSHYIIWRSDNGINYNTSYSTSSTTFRVDSNLAEQATYYFRVMAVDTNGNYSEGSNIFWETTPVADNIPPDQPILQTPDEPDIGESFVNLRWEAVLDNVAVERYSIEVKEGISVVNQVNVPNPSATGMILQTVTGLKPNTTYSITVTAYDTSGNASLASGPINITTKMDTTAPKIILKKPSEGAINVPYGQPIIIRFNEAIDPATVNNSSFKVMNGGTEIPGNITVKENEIVFETDSLVAVALYEVTLETTITNISGIPLEQQIIYTFTTGTEKYERPHGNYMDNTALCKYCHNAHTGERPRLLNQKQIYEVCFTCHDGTGAEGDGSIFNVGQQFRSSQTTFKASHHPVFPEDWGVNNSEGVTDFSCVKCHNPHDSGKNLATGENNSSWKRLLDSYNKGDLSGIQPTADHQGKEFCWNCHGKTDNDGVTDQNGFSFGYLDDYDKNGNSILSRTDVTGITFSENRYRTDHQTYFPIDSPTNPPVTDKPAFGYGHNSWKMETYKKDFANGASASGTNITCVACHEKHGSEVKPLLRTDINGNVNPIKNGKEFCYQCHQNSVDFGYSDWASETNQNAYDGKTINEKRGHAQFDCQVCHNPHGSPYPNYLRLPYRVTTNVSNYNYNKNDFALCFDCHDESLLTTQGAKIQGDKDNYHYYHLNLNTTRGKTPAICKNCHRPHGAIEAENDSGKTSHRIGFPALSSEITSNGNGYTKPRYHRDMAAKNSTTGGNGRCTLLCHGGDHKGYTDDNDSYDGAYRDIVSATNPYMLKTNWKENSWLLNNRPTYYKNGANGTTHYRDGDFPENPTQTTNNDGFHWK